MILDPIISALRKRCKTLDGRVAGAAQWAGLTEDESPPLPAAYVVPLREDAGSMDDAVGYYQVVTNTFGVILLVSNFADERGQDASRWIELLKPEVFKAILSWTMKPRDHLRGRVFDLHGRRPRGVPARVLFRDLSRHERHVPRSRTQCPARIRRRGHRCRLHRSIHDEGQA